MIYRSHENRALSAICVGDNTNNIFLFKVFTLLRFTKLKQYLLVLFYNSNKPNHELLWFRSTNYCLEEFSKLELFYTTYTTNKNHLFLIKEIKDLIFEWEVLGGKENQETKSKRI